MKPVLALLLLAAVLASCGGTAAPTPLPPTQTPWIVVVTSTAQPEDVPPAATEMPAATATRRAQPTATRGLAPAVPTVTDLASLPIGTVLATAGPAGATPAAATPSSTPAASTLKYPPPALLEPPDRRPVSWKSTVLLQWSSVGALAEDEYYHVHLERRPKTPGEGWYGDYVLTKETEFRAEGPFLAPFHPSTEHGFGMVYWWVWVVRKTGQDANGKPTGVDLSPYSEERLLILEPKPAGE